mgnify:CR=1 FL=1
MRALIIVGKYTYRVGSFIANFIARDEVDEVILPMRDRNHELAGEVVEGMGSQIHYACVDGESPLIECVGFAIATGKPDAVLFITATPTREWQDALRRVLRQRYFMGGRFDVYTAVVNRENPQYLLNPLMVVEELSVKN